MKNRIFLLLAFMLASLCALADSYSKYVGESFFLPYPKLNLSNGYIREYRYEPTLNVEIVNQTTGEARIRKFFTGTEIIVCRIYYVIYSPSGWETYGDTQESHYVTCKSNDIRLSAPKTTIDVGETIQLNYSLSAFTYDAYPEVDFTVIDATSWNCVSLSSGGYVRGVEPGTATIRATSNLGNNASTVTITVRDNSPTSVSIPESLSVYVGEESTLKPTLKPSYASTSYTWYSDNKAIASVSGGTVRGVDEGSTYVYCKTANGLYSNNCKVTVKYRVPTGIKVTPDNISLGLHKTRQLTYALEPSNAKATVKWSSENDKIAKVSDSGLVTPVKAGTTRIVATTDNGKKGYCSVTVLPDPERVTLPSRMLLNFGSSRKLSYSIAPSDACIDLTWMSDNPEIATVSQDGTVTAKSPGYATVTVKTHNGKEARCVVEIPVPDFRFLIWMTGGGSVSYPLAEHPLVAYSDGNLVLKSENIETIFNPEDVSKFTLSREIVEPMPESIYMPDELTLKFRETCSIDYRLRPEDCDFETLLTWTTSDDHVVRVSQNGVVRAVGPGEAYVKLTASNGCSASCHVTVPEPEYYLIVWLEDGRKLSYHLSEHPVAKYEADRFTVSTTREEIWFDAENMRKFTLSDNRDGVDTSSVGGDVAKPGAQVSYDGDTMTLSGGRPGALTRLYDISGMIVGEYRADSEGTVRISMSSLPSGLIIVKSENITFKIIRR